MGAISDSPLGRAARYPEAYDPGLLYAVERAPQRAELGLEAALPFRGVDRWTAWEASWLDATGRPRAGIATFEIDCRSPRLVESKSVKLWLASLEHARFASIDDVAATLRRDLAQATGAPVAAAVHAPEAWAGAFARRMPDGTAIDDVTPVPHPSAPDASVLACAGAPVAETLLMRAFRSVCPVTGQPDHAEVTVAYRGERIDRAALYGYLLGYRRHPSFHEHCVERIFVDLDRACRPEALCVQARFTRRGGVDINPVRFRGDVASAAAPTLRQ